VSYRHDGLEERIHSIDILGGNIQLFLAKLEKKTWICFWGIQTFKKKKKSFKIPQDSWISLRKM